MRLNAIRQTNYLAPSKGSITSSYCHHINTISQSPSRAVLSGCLFYGVQFHSYKGHFSSEPFGLLLDRLRDSCVWGPGGPPFQLPASRLQESGSFKVRGASYPQQSLSNSNFAFKSCPMEPFIHQLSYQPASAPVLGNQVKAEEHSGSELVGEIRSTPYHLPPARLGHGWGVFLVSFPFAFIFIIHLYRAHWFNDFGLTEYLVYLTMHNRRVLCGSDPVSQ